LDKRWHFFRGVLQTLGLVKSLVEGDLVTAGTNSFGVRADLRRSSQNDGGGNVSEANFAVFGQFLS